MITYRRVGKQPYLQHMKIEIGNKITQLFIVNKKLTQESCIFPTRIYGHCPFHSNSSAPLNDDEFY